MNAALRAFVVLALIGAGTLAACRSSDRDASDGDASVTADSAAHADSAGSMAGMADMPGMGGAMGGMMGAGMIDSMQAHLRMMDSVSADRIEAMLPMHRQMVANMISRMNSEMRGMNMPAGGAWSMTVDSLRQDLTHMPDMSAAELEAMMPAHHARMMRLMQMHQAMMGGMKP